MWTAILLACVSQVCFAVAGLLQKWLMNKSKITPVQLTLWTSLGAVFCTLVYYSLIVRRPEEIMFIDNFKYAPVFVLGIIVLSLLGIQCGLFASKISKRPEILVAFVVVGVAVQYGVGTAIFGRSQKLSAWIGIAVATVGLGLLAFT